MTSYRWAIEASTASLAKLADELHGYFRKRVRSTGDAEDLVGQTWLAAGRNFAGRSTLRYYLFAVAKRLVWDYCRLTTRRPWIYSDRDDPETLPSELPELDISLERSEDVQRLRQALAQLPEHYVVVIELALLGYKHPQIAEILGINYNTVRSRHVRGTARLARLLGARRE
jgi:RNA polymerase sigma-70 factor (ECF subfamily)